MRAIYLIMLMTLFSLATPLSPGGKNLRKETLPSPSSSFPSDLLPPTITEWSGGAEDIGKLVLYQDAHLIVAYKPPGVLIQSSADRPQDGQEEEVNMISMLQRMQQSAKVDPVTLLHRIDRPCSGLVLFGRNKVASRKLNEAFSERLVTKGYVAMVNGNITQPGECDDYLRQLQGEKTRVLPKKTENSQHARLTYRPLGMIEYDIKPSSQPSSRSHRKIQTLLDINLETGRKHQIRAQLAHRGWTVCGDGKYGAPQTFLTRDITLHAYKLELAHPHTGEPLRFTCPPPKVWERRFGPQAWQSALRLVR
eukprot:scaffold1091_cov164-Ochromonas_danica.AAC.12